MHELGVTQSLLELALRHANKAGAVRVKELNLVIGELSSIVDDSIQFYWDMIAAGTIAQGATLNFKRIAAGVRCQNCGHTSGVNHRDFICPACGNSHVEVLGGDEFFLESIDVDFE